MKSGNTAAAPSQSAGSPSPLSSSSLSSSPLGSSAVAPVQSIKLLFAGLMVTQLLSALNQTVLSSALPTIVGELNGVEHMTWVITAFILTATVTMPIYGKLSDLLGRKPLLIAAILIFVGGSIFGAVATDMSTLIVARAIQGLGGGGLMILSQAAIADVIPARERGKYMGIMGAVFAALGILVQHSTRRFGARGNHHVLEHPSPGVDHQA